MQMRRTLFLLFFVSGACGLLYQIVWLRLAFASFGVITPVLSVVIAIFMLGLALGSWVAGKWVGAWSRRTGLSAIYFYVMAEVVVGVSAFVVPSLFRVGASWLLPLRQADSFAYLLYSALILAGAILPACIAMGTTYPLMLAFVKESVEDDDSSFSFLYVANVMGACAGTLLTAIVLVELFGFRMTLLLAGLANISLAGIAIYLGRQHRHTADVGSKAKEPEPQVGFSWQRAGLPLLLLSTMAGSMLYRRHLNGDGTLAYDRLLGLLGITVLLPVLINDPRLHDWQVIALLSILPFSALLGYLTPKLVDDYSRGFPGLAGRAYAINVLGSILGPLCAGYLILPALGTREGMVLLAVPFLLLPVVYWKLEPCRDRWLLGTGSVATAMVARALLFSISHEEGLHGEDVEIRRDHTATVLSFGEGLSKQMLVNGTGITIITPITKIMAHMPMLAHPGPSSAAVICFGMGTTLRSAMS